MLAVAAKLRGAAPVDPRGVAALKQLLTDGGSSLYAQWGPGTLIGNLERIDGWLDADR